MIHVTFSVPSVLARPPAAPPPLLHLLPQSLLLQQLPSIAHHAWMPQRGYNRETLVNVETRRHQHHQQPTEAQRCSLAQRRISLILSRLKCLKISPTWCQMLVRSICGR